MKRWWYIGFSLFLIQHNVAVAQRQSAAVKSATSLSVPKFSVEQDSLWSNLFVRKNGWFGGDGIYSIPLNGKENSQASKQDQLLFIFSDSMIGRIDNRDSLQTGSVMVHNTVAMLQGNLPDPSKINFYWPKDKLAAPQPVFIPQTPHTKAGDYYWLGDGFTIPQQSQSLYIFGYRVRTFDQSAFGFKQVGNTLIKLKASANPPYVDEQYQLDMPSWAPDKNGNSVSFGSGVYVNLPGSGAPSPDGYIYIYGTRGPAKELLAARVRPGDVEHFERWTFWDGTSWTQQADRAAVLTQGVSDELSITAIPGGLYVLVFQVNGITPIIGMRLAHTPVGPFGPVIKVWDCSADLLQKTYLVYNAKVHPNLSAPGELLISYNVNSTEFFKDLQRYPHLYRPRFIRLKFKGK
jgi:hypothetical protein